MRQNDLRRFPLYLALSAILTLNATQTSPADEPQVYQDSLTELTVAKIMRDPKWIGVSPSGIHFSEDSRKVYFNWNPEGAADNLLYSVSRNSNNPRKVSLEEQKNRPARRGDYSRDRAHKIYSKDGDIYILKTASGTIRQITRTEARESSPTFNHTESKIIYSQGRDLFSWDFETGTIEQLTDFQKGSAPSDDKGPDTENEQWIAAEESTLITTLRRRKESSERRKARSDSLKTKPLYTIYTKDEAVSSQELSPDERFVTFEQRKSGSDGRETLIPRYVTESGYTENWTRRTNVGRPESSYRFGIFNRESDTVYYVSVDSLTDITLQPVYLREQQAAKDSAASAENADDSEDDSETESEDEPKKEEPKPRPVNYHGPYWSDNGSTALLIVSTQDNKDRWITLLDPETGTLEELYHYHDEAWIGGPGFWGGWSAGPLGWLPDNKRIWFASEETGWMQLYTLDVTNKKQTAFTNGEFEIRDISLSHDKKRFYFSSNQVHFGEKHFYHLSVDGGTPIQITTMTGRNDVTISPDEKTLAIKHSYMNQPWELYLMDNKPGAAARRITNSQTEEFNSYPWREPEIIRFSAGDGAQVPARLYRSESATTGGPAVIFVHGAGYLQNAHKWWSQYYREYMFHNLLVDNGYTVLDIDYRASAGLGREWRTGIYRHMGGKDLSDQVDGARYLVRELGVDSARIGIYGGSYGGFITLMAMFTEPGIFAAGAGLRSVTDWAHYNHGYTSNILNIPQLDSLAYVRSSPIYFAEGLEGALLICHGMLDDNVHFQDVVRLSQRLIELGKDNWELAVYPLERHSFVEPESWTDEYSRIFKLFEENLK
jgi:dipeptidyl aminopeptidase/acylaminoacyl peptidase